jgi:penicillin-binding protein 1A
MDQMRRGSRTANRGSASPPRKSRAEPPRERPRWRIWLRRLLVWGGAFAALLLLALATSVYFAARSMPGYSTLMSSQVGQTIVVRARDGSEVVALGPSYGEWL